MLRQVVSEVACHTGLERRQAGLGLDRIAGEFLGQVREGIAIERSRAILDFAVPALQDAEGIGGNEGIPAQGATRDRAIEEQRARQRREAREDWQTLAIGNFLDDETRHGITLGKSAKRPLEVLVLE